MIAIIDTSVLITLYMIERVTHLNMIYQLVLIPIKVEEEFMKQDPDNKFAYLNRLYEENTWIQKCQTYHHDIFDLLRSEPKIDAGEQEALAQYKAIEADLIVEPSKITCVLDERNARDIAAGMQINITGTLYILARLHFNGIIDYFEVTSRIKHARRYSDKRIQEAFTKVQQELGIA